MKREEEKRARGREGLWEEERRQERLSPQPVRLASSCSTAYGIAAGGHYAPVTGFIVWLQFTAGCELPSS